jgi:membrane protein
LLTRLRRTVAETYTQWREDRAPLLAAALSFYTLFSVAPLLLVVVGVAGFFFGEEGARQRLIEQVAQATGPAAAESVGKLLEGAAGQREHPLPAFIGVAMLLLGASAVFAQLKLAMNIIWNVPPRPKDPGAAPAGLLQKAGSWLRPRALSFALMLAAGLILLASLFVSAILRLVLEFVETMTPLQQAAYQTGDVVLSIATVTVTFALLFKVMPDAEVPWREAWTGALFTSLLFNVGKFGISIYLGSTAVASKYGAAGSVVVILLWVYYACQIVFFGAELTQVISDKDRSRSASKAKKPKEAVLSFPRQPAPGRPA